MTHRLRLERDQLDLLLTALQADGRQLVGPTPRDGAVVLDRIRGVADLPRGLGTESAPGSCRLVGREDDALFGFVLGPDAAKRWLHPPRVELWRARRTEDGFELSEPAPSPRLALLGLRACDLAAIAIQDRVLRDGPTADPTYASRRSDLLVVAVQCAESVSTCFCTSMNTGPRVESGFDLCLTEVLGDDPHFVVEVGTEAGEALLAAMPVEPVQSVAPEEAAADASSQQRVMPGDVRQRLLGALQGPHWDEVASRCLSCANCTLVCPTCFCTTVEDVTLLSGEAVHQRRWDSCFDVAFSDLHGRPVRKDTAHRYRQWLTHKLATWHDQFDTSGCVGCGRCIAWCPAGIDIVEEARTIGGSP